VVVDIDDRLPSLRAEVGVDVAFDPPLEPGPLIYAAFPAADAAAYLRHSRP
jgi:hypothetical protein